MDHQIATAVAQDLFAAERDIDRACSSTAQFASRLMWARMEAGLAMQADNGAFKRVTSALASLAEVREELIAAHKSVAVVNRALGSPTKLNGGDKPAMPDSDIAVASATDARRHLRAIEAA